MSYRRNKRTGSVIWNSTTINAWSVTAVKARSGRWRSGKGDIGNALGGPFRVPAPESIPPEAQLINAIIEAGLEAPSEIHIDGKDT